MNRRAVIFDMDGVLVDSYRPHYLSWQRLAADHGLEMTEQQFAANFGRTGREIIHSLWRGRFSEEEALAADAKKELHYRQILTENFPEMAGASDLLRQLHQAGFALAIGSSGPPENVEVVVRALPAGDLLAATVNGMEVTRGKPDPAVFLLAARKVDVEPSRCAVIEDAPAGVEAALAAGMAAIAITGTASPEKLSHANLLIDSLSQLSPRLIADLIDSHERRS